MSCCYCVLLRHNLLHPVGSLTGPSFREIMTTSYCIYYNEMLCRIYTLDNDKDDDRDKSRRSQISQRSWRQDSPMASQAGLILRGDSSHLLLLISLVPRDRSSSCAWTTGSSSMGPAHGTLRAWSGPQLQPHNCSSPVISWSKTSGLEIALTLQVCLVVGHLIVFF